MIIESASTAHHVVSKIVHPKGTNISIFVIFLKVIFKTFNKRKSSINISALFGFIFICTMRIINLILFTCKMQKSNALQFRLINAENDIEIIIVVIEQ